MLKSADLSFAKLGHANLTRGDASLSDLTFADLRKATLNKTNLNGADLSEARLDGADLSGSFMFFAVMPKRMCDVNVAGAHVQETIFAGVALREVIGLETAEHWGPSTIGIDTLYASKGDIPEVFLRGCGVPEDMIEFARSIAGAIQIYSCFISYAVHDEVFARRLYSDLQGAGIRCWLAQEDLQPGDRTWFVIEDQIRIKDKLLLILSEASIESEAVQREVKHGLDQEAKQNKQILFPIYIDDAALKSRKRWVAALRAERNFGDFTRWAEPAIYDLRLKQVIDWLKPDGGAPASS